MIKQSKENEIYKLLYFEENTSSHCCGRQHQCVTVFCMTIFFIGSSYCIRNVGHQFIFVRLTFNRDQYDPEVAEKRHLDEIGGLPMNENIYSGDDAPLTERSG